MENKVEISKRDSTSPKLFLSIACILDSKSSSRFKTDWQTGMVCIYIVSIVQHNCFHEKIIMVLVSKIDD